MNRPDSTEMDRLLRRFAWRNDKTAPAGREQREDGQDADNRTHLDADELNAFAEGALPDGARSRYFAHLADCDSCRKLITELTLAATVANEQQAQVAPASVPSSKSWRDWLAAILSPRVLRYGVPALALLAIIVVAMVATRARRDERFVAEQKEEAGSYAPSTASNSNSTTTTETTAENHSNSSATTSNTSASVPPQNPASQASAAGKPAQEKDGTILAQSQPVTQPEVAKSAEEQRGGASKQPAPGEAGKVMDETATVTAAPPPAPTPVLSSSTTTTTEAENKDKREDRKRAQAAESDDQVRSSTNAVGGAASPLSINGAARDTSGRRASRAVQNLPAAKPASPAKSEPADVAAEQERPAETRNVKGHKFRKQGGAWVDTAYNSSFSTISVARGSEQYRALVADEPELRTITQQLGGEVIVVWKGRAYRFD